MVLVDAVSRTLLVEENGLIDALGHIIKVVNGLYIETAVRERLIKSLNLLLDDTIKHSNLLSGLLVELSV